jgi:hypothetical protein
MAWLTIPPTSIDAPRAKKTCSWHHPGFRAAGQEGGLVRALQLKIRQRTSPVRALLQRVLGLFCGLPATARHCRRMGTALSPRLKIVAGHGGKCTNAETPYQGGTRAVSRPVQLVLVVLFILAVKHFVFDYLLQTEYQYRNKGTYGHPGGILHAGLHAFGTLPAFLVIAPSLTLGVGLVIGEFLVHYHIDWTKEQILRRRGWTYPASPFWWVFGADQLLHQLTYIGIAAVLAIGAGL